MSPILRALFALPVFIVAPAVATMAEDEGGERARPVVATTTIVQPVTTTKAPAPTTTLPDLSSVDFNQLAITVEEERHANNQIDINAERREHGKCGEWHDLAIAVGWPESEWPTLSYVLYRESRCNIDSWNKTDPSSGSRGLMQINGFWCRPNKYDPNGFLQTVGILNTCEDLFNPRINLQSGLAIWTYGTNKYGCGWRGPWATSCGKYSVAEPHPGA